MHYRSVILRSKVTPPFSFFRGKQADQCGRLWVICWLRISAPGLKIELTSSITLRPLPHPVCVRCSFHCHLLIALEHYCLAAHRQGCLKEPLSNHAHLQPVIKGHIYNISYFVKPYMSSGKPECEHPHTLIQRADTQYRQLQPDLLKIKSTITWQPSDWYQLCSINQFMDDKQYDAMVGGDPDQIRGWIYSWFVWGVNQHVGGS